jgi:hypothetical protein
MLNVPEPTAQERGDRHVRNPVETPAWLPRSDDESS